MQEIIIQESTSVLSTITQIAGALGFVLSLTLAILKFRENRNMLQIRNMVIVPFSDESCARLKKDYLFIQLDLINPTAKTNALISATLSAMGESTENSRAHISKRTISKGPQLLTTPMPLTIPPYSAQETILLFHLPQLRSETRRRVLADNPTEVPRAVSDRTPIFYPCTDMQLLLSTSRGPLQLPCTCAVLRDADEWKNERAARLENLLSLGKSS